MKKLWKIMNALHYINTVSTLLFICPYQLLPWEWIDLHLMFNGSIYCVWYLHILCFYFVQLKANTETDWFECDIASWLIVFAIKYCTLFRIMFAHSMGICNIVFKCPSCNPNMLFWWHKSGDIDNIIQFSVDSEVAFVSCASFTVSYCYIGYYVGNY